MPPYEICLHLVSGQTVKITQVFDDWDSCAKNLDQQVNAEICRLSSKTDRAVLSIRKPRENVIAYSQDEV